MIPQLRPESVRVALRRMAPPKQQLGNLIRWLFLVFGLLNLLTVAPRVLTSTMTPVPLKPAAIAMEAFTLAWWLRGYHRRSFPAWTIPFEGIAFATIGLGLHDWVGTVGLMFVMVSFRGLYDTWRHVLGLTSAVFAGGVAAVGLTQSDRLGAFLLQCIGVPTLALFTAAVALSTGRQERANARERVFARLGATLATTSDREAICRHAAEAAEQLLAGTPGGWAVVTLVGPDGEVATTASGPVPMELLTGPIDLTGLPPAPDTALQQGRAVHLDNANGLARTGMRMLAALRSDKQRYGTLLVGAARPIPDEVQPSIETLVGQTALGLVNAAYAADLHHQAFHDPLTGLANRSLLREHLAHALARARRGGPVAVLLIDLDGFKQVNDSYGHAAGDQLLLAVAQRLRDGVRGADTAARLGGDEFAVLLDGMDAPDDALLVACRLLASIQQPVHLGGVDLRPQGSLGLAIWRGHRQIDALLHDADTAMYAAKTAGKGRVAYLDELGDIVVMARPVPVSS